MPKKRILITVKTYPTLSTSYGELVCTAGLREDGTWVRIYPVPFRQLQEYQKFEKYRIIEAGISRNKRDPRPESHKVDTGSLTLTETILSTKDAWRERRNWVLHRGEVFDDLTELIERANTENSLSLATFKPSEIIDFKAEPQSPDWDEKKIVALQALSNQGELFPEWEPAELTKLVSKLPWKFSYTPRRFSSPADIVLIDVLLYALFRVLNNNLYVNSLAAKSTALNPSRLRAFV